MAPSTNRERPRNNVDFSPAETPPRADFTFSAYNQGFPGSVWASTCEISLLNHISVTRLTLAQPDNLICVRTAPDQEP